MMSFGTSTISLWTTVCLLLVTLIYITPIVTAADSPVETDTTPPSRDLSPSHDLSPVASGDHVIDSLGGSAIQTLNKNLSGSSTTNSSVSNSTTASSGVDGYAETEPSSLVITATPKYPFVKDRITVQCTGDKSVCGSLDYSPQPSNSTITVSDNGTHWNFVMEFVAEVSGASNIFCLCVNATGSASPLKAAWVFIHEPLKPAENVRCVSHNYEDLSIYWTDPNFKSWLSPVGKWEISFAVLNKGRLGPTGWQSYCKTNSSDGELVCTPKKAAPRKFGSQYHGQTVEKPMADKPYSYLLHYSGPWGHIGSHIECSIDDSIVTVNPVTDFLVTDVTASAATVAWTPRDANKNSMIRFFLQGFSASITYGITITRRAARGEPNIVDEYHEVVSRDTRVRLSLTNLLPISSFEVSVAAKSTKSHYWSENATVVFATREGFPEVGPAVHPTGYSFSPLSTCYQSTLGYTSPSTEAVTIYWRKIDGAPLSGNGNVTHYTLRVLSAETIDDLLHISSLSNKDDKRGSTSRSEGLNLEVESASVSRVRASSSETSKLLCLPLGKFSKVFIEGWTSGGVGNVSSVVTVSPQSIVSDSTPRSCEITASVEIPSGKISLSWPTIPPFKLDLLKPKYTVFWCEADDSGCKGELNWADAGHATSYSFTVHAPNQLTPPTRVGVAATLRGLCSTGIVWASCVGYDNGTNDHDPKISFTVSGQTVNGKAVQTCGWATPHPLSMAVVYCERKSEGCTNATDYCCKAEASIVPVSLCETEVSLRLSSPNTMYSFWVRNYYTHRWSDSDVFIGRTADDTAFPLWAYGPVAIGIALLIAMTITLIRHKLRPSVELKRVRVPDLIDVNFPVFPLADQNVSLGRAESPDQDGDMMLERVNMGGCTSYSYIWSSDLARSASLQAKDKLLMMQTSRDSGMPDEGYVLGRDRKGLGKTRRHTYANQTTDGKQAPDWISLPDSSSSFLLEVEDESDGATISEASTAAHSLPRGQKDTPPPQYQHCYPHSPSPLTVSVLTDDEGYHGPLLTPDVHSTCATPNSSYHTAKVYHGDNFDGHICSHGDATALSNSAAKDAELTALLFAAAGSMTRPSVGKQLSSSSSTSTTSSSLGGCKGDGVTAEKGITKKKPIQEEDNKSTSSSDVDSYVKYGAESESEGENSALLLNNNNTRQRSISEHDNETGSEGVPVMTNIDDFLRPSRFDIKPLATPMSNLTSAVIGATLEKDICPSENESLSPLISESEANDKQEEVVSSDYMRIPMTY